MKKARIGIVAAIFIILVVTPYIFAWRAGGSTWIFSGFLLNPQDGNSYLAKMYEGWQGSWLFTLPYSVNPGKGAYLFLYYLFLGNLAHWLGLPLLLVYHMARIIGAVVLVWALARFFFTHIKNEDVAFLAFSLTCLGSGLGWLAYGFTHQLTSDFWVAEAYPFLSAYVNPHFPLALSIMLWLFVLPPGGIRLRQCISRTLAGFFLGLLLPFGVVITGLVLALESLWSGWGNKKFEWRTWFFPILGGGPVLLYQFWVVMTNPSLGAWNAQNITPSPAVWDLVVSLSPALILAIAGVIGKIRVADRGQRLLIVWAFVSMILLLIPFSLQRRFILGIFIPLAGLAAYGIELIARQEIKRYRLVSMATYILSFPTLLIVLLTGWVGMQTHDPALYMTQNEAQAMSWITTHTVSDAVILAAPDTGSFIPAWTGRRVLYGHPFETIDAEAQKEKTIQLLTGLNNPIQTSTALDEIGIDYVFYGPREKKLAPHLQNETFTLVYQNPEVNIFKVQP